MGVQYNPKIVTNGLVLAYDMGNKNKSWIGRPTTNSVDALSQQILRYNNPGFSGNSVDTGLKYRGMPIYELTFIPQDSTYVSRLGSGEGFGGYHTFGTSLLANTNYMASVYFKSDFPLLAAANEGFNNTYSNISGWGQNTTSETRYSEDGWTRLYSQYKNNVNGYSSRTSTFQTNFTVNTASTQNVDITFTIPLNGVGITDFATLYALVGATPAIASNGGLTGLTIVDHGLNTTNFQKMSWPSVIRLKATDLPLSYYVRLSVPSTGGTNVTVAIQGNFAGYYTALTDNKFWKITFNTTGVIAGQVLRTYWCCPMIEQHDVVYPSTFVNGTRTNTQSILDLTRINTITATELTYANDGTFSFDGVNDYLDCGTNIQIADNFTLEAWHKNINTGYILDQGALGTDPNGCLEWTNRGLTIQLNNADGTSATGSFSDTTRWNHVVCSFSAGTVKFYINGVLDSTKTMTSTAFTPSGMLKIGRRAFDTTAIMSGQLAAVRVYNRVLTDDEVSQNFDALRGRFGI
jgi:hypothetical protein